MADVFVNNSANDYINPALAPCAGTSDTDSFEFLPGQQVGVISGSTILSAMGLGDISQVVSGWVQQTKILASGELVFIQGLTKGISYAAQRFLLTDTSSVTHSDYYMSVDLSIDYYNNFRYHEDAVHVTGDWSESTPIDTALDVEFAARGIRVDAAYVDACTLTFTGTQQGYWFDVTNVEASTWVPDTSVYGETLVEDVSSAVPAYKYPNTAMLGYVLKATYPDDEADSDRWIEINHVPDYLTYYEASTGDTNSYVRNRRAVDVGLSGTSCSGDTLSAADYLDWVETNGEWDKVGVLRIWLSAPDPASSIENLITGFYVFNPQSFSVKIEYMTIL